jgi:FtsH-binding integral membrane protein
MKIGFKRQMLIAKIKTTQYLFGNISFCLLLSLIVTILFSVALLFTKHTTLSIAISTGSVFLLSMVLFVILEVVRKLYYLLDDDFSEIIKPIK